MPKSRTKSSREAVLKSDVHVPAGARLLNLEQAAIYTGLSYWTIRDYVQAGVLPKVSLPCAKRRAPGGAVVRRPGDASVRTILVDRRDLDRLIERSKDRQAG